MRTLIARLSVVLVLFFIGFARADEATGSIAGLVRYTGAVPKAKQVMTDAGPVEVREIDIDAKTRGLRHVFVVLEDAPARPVPKDAASVLIDQRGMIFLPRVVGVHAGQKVRFENNDAFNHSILAVSTLEKNQLNVIATPRMPIEVEFVPQKRPIRIGCSMHFWMRAWVFVVKHPWFAVTDDQGRFRIDKVPPGKYTLLIRHQDRAQETRKQIVVKAGATTEVNVDWNKLGK